MTHLDFQLIQFSFRIIPKFEVSHFHSNLLFLNHLHWYSVLLVSFTLLSNLLNLIAILDDSLILNSCFSIFCSFYFTSYLIFQILTISSPFLPLFLLLILSSYNILLFIFLITHPIILDFLTSFFLFLIQFFSVPEFIIFFWLTFLLKFISCLFPSFLLLPHPVFVVPLSYLYNFYC